PGTRAYRVLDGDQAAGHATGGSGIRRERCSVDRDHVVLLVQSRKRRSGNGGVEAHVALDEDRNATDERGRHERVPYVDRVVRPQEAHWRPADVRDCAVHKIKEHPVEDVERAADCGARVVGESHQVASNVQATPVDVDQMREVYASADRDRAIGRPDEIVYLDL